MKPEELTAEQKAKLMACKNFDELMSALGSMGVELSDEQLDAVAGGGSWGGCEGYSCTYFFNKGQ